MSNLSGNSHPSAYFSGSFSNGERDRLEQKFGHVDQSLRFSLGSAPVGASWVAVAHRKGFVSITRFGIEGVFVGDSVEAAVEQIDTWLQRRIGETAAG